MTKEQYEGTPELIFYCEYNPNDFEDRLEIPFTNEYEITMSKGKSHNSIIKIDLKTKQSKILKNFFGDNILNVTAIAGKNGVGKTNVLSSLYTKRGKKFYNFIAIYKQEQLIVESSVGARIDDYTLKIFLNNVPQSILFINNILNQNSNIKCKQGFIGLIPREERNLNYYDNLIATSVLDKTFSSTYHFLCDSFFKKLFTIDIKRMYMNIIFDSPYIHPLELTTNNANFILCLLEAFNRQLSLVYKYSKDAPRRSGSSKRKDENGNYKINLVFQETPDINAFNEDGILLSYLKQIDNLRLLLKDNSEINYIHNSIISCIDVLLKDFKKYKLFISSSEYANLFASLSSLQEITSDILKINLLEIFGEDNYSFGSHQLLVIFPTTFSNEVYQFLKLIEMIDMNAFGININFGQYSSGEEAILQQIAAMYQFILEDLKNSHSIMFFLDEYEQHLHPEWSRKYLSYLLKFLEAEGQRLGIKFQVVLTTHSPYLISDLPKENIILLEKDKETSIRTARKSNYGFASNYYDIMSDNFFLDDTIGEFAKQKINECIQSINRISDDLDKIGNDELIFDNGLFLFVEDSLKTIEEQNKIINLVGDKFIQKQLQKLSDSVRQRLLAHSDDSIRKHQIEQDIAELEEKLRQKKMELNND